MPDGILTQASRRMNQNQDRKSPDPTTAETAGFWNAFARYHASVENNQLELAVRSAFEIYERNLFEMVIWVAKRASVSHLSAAFLLLRMFLHTTRTEKWIALRMQRIFRKIADPKSLKAAAPETQLYRNQAAIQSLFERLAIPVKQLSVHATCYIARIQ